MYDSLMLFHFQFILYIVFKLHFWKARPHLLSWCQVGINRTLEPSCLNHTKIPGVLILPQGYWHHIVRCCLILGNNMGWEFKIFPSTHSVVCCQRRLQTSPTSLPLLHAPNTSSSSMQSQSPQGFLCFVVQILLLILFFSFSILYFSRIDFGNRTQKPELDCYFGSYR